MKPQITKFLKILLYPLLWCRQVLLEASDTCCYSGSIGSGTYGDFRAPEESSRPVYQVSVSRPRAAR